MSEEFRSPYPEYESLNLHDLAVKLTEIRKELDEIKVRSAEFNKRYDYIRLNLIPGLMEESDISTVTYEDVGRITVTGDIYASIPAASRDDAYSWLRENGFGDLITDYVHPGTLKSFLKGQIKKGREIPEFFRVHPFERASITKV